MKNDIAAALKTETHSLQVECLLHISHRSFQGAFNFRSPEVIRMRYNPHAQLLLCLPSTLSSAGRKQLFYPEWQHLTALCNITVYTRRMI